MSPPHTQHFLGPETGRPVALPAGQPMAMQFADGAGGGYWADGASGRLAAGQRLDSVVIEEVLSAGVATTVYRAFDQATQAVVVLKEYLPLEVANRNAERQVQHRLPRWATAFQAGLKAFVEEAKLLQSFDHPALVKVLRQWQQDGTAYQTLVMHRGVTLKRWLADLGTPPSETWLRQLLPPLMDALDTLHKRGCHHRNVSPEKVWLRFDDQADSYLEQRPQPMLLGFGSAQRAIGQALANPTQEVLEDGFASLEQSDGAITARLGAWTDVYGLCAVLYSAIAGRAPPPSLRRAAGDTMASAQKLGRGRYSPAFLAAIDAGLVVQPQERLQSIAELRELLERAALPVDDGGAAVFSVSAAVKSKPLWVWPALVGSLLLLAAAIGGLVFL